ncbi:MAG: hypothetical protein NT079_00255 [Candidatus Omnitrophica bacterium]|nr:hypothetical protein [Candidatus Omnitrophota bacterium]
MRGPRSVVRRFLQAVCAERHEVNYETPLNDLIEGRFPDVHAGITADSFPPEEDEFGRKTVEFWLFPDSELGDGYVAASLREILALCSVNPRSFRKYRIFATRRGIAGPGMFPYFPFICKGRIGLSSRPTKPSLNRFLGVKYLETEE